MGPSLAAIVFISLALAAAYFLRPRIAENPAAVRASIFWFAATPLIYLIYPILGALAAGATLLALLTPKGLDNRAAYYLMALFAIPAGMKTEIPFPGINYLIVIDHPTIACLLLLAPAAALIRHPNAARYAPTAGILILLLTALMSIQGFRTENITNGLRGAVGFVILYALPYLGVIRLVSSRGDMDKIFAATLSLGVIFACLAFVSEAADWNFYTLLTERHGVLAMADVREGILRVSVTVAPVLVGFVATLALLAAEYFRAEKKLGALSVWLYRAMLIVTAIFTFSRGAWAAMAIGAAVFYFFTKFPRGVRPPLIVIGVVFIAPVALTYLMNANLNRFDPYGSFEYRRELLQASLVQIRQHPFFGDPNYLQSGNFDNLYQGQGIIDVVNYYLQITLEHGLVGLSLFVGAFISVIVGLLRLGRLVRRNNDRALELQRAVLLGGLAAYLVMIGTVSNVSLVPHLAILLLALSAAFIAATRRELTARATATKGDRFD